MLPSLWEAVTGKPVVDRDFAPDVALVWGWKDELPGRKLVCAGKHLGGRASFVSLELLPVLYALTGRSGQPADFRDEELSPIERDVAEALLESGPISSAELPSFAGHERKRVSAAAARLQRRLVVTSAGRQEHDQGWPSIVFDILPRRYGDRLGALPEPDDARADSRRRRSCRRPAKSRQRTSRRSSAARGSRPPRLSSGSPSRARRGNAMQANTCSGLSSSGPSLPTPHH